ncbi:uncharacterized protein LOC126909289 [Daktulosphaira vitifoliae]|uniref:uncharacterized protein LOC126909289 n=1 Tax=Daktulosphaira vitifoliae TaxID=58002 RepID=UPI0021AA79D9|nr:uncharacterized protein LOC126909289 [Daktulosphaira vitifoliae]
MNRRKESNKFLIENDEKNLISLKNIYLYDIIENKELFKTILMIFGEQSEENFETIYKEIRQEYLDAKNYYWFDLWFYQVGKYQQKLLNIFKTVLLHLMTKYVTYIDILQKTNYYIIPLVCHKIFVIALSDKINLFDKMEQNWEHYQNILDSFDDLPLFKCWLKSSISVKIWNIKKLQKNELFLKCGLQPKDLSNEYFYASDTISRIGWANNYERMILYLYNLKTLFNETSLKIIHSFITYSNYFRQMDFNRSDEEMNTVRLLEL